MKLYKKRPIMFFITSLFIVNLYIFIQFLSNGNLKNFFGENNIDKNFFRLHVVANSDSTEDQIVKLKSTNKIENYFNNLFKNNKKITLDNIDEYIKNNSNEILDIADNTLKEENFNYKSYLKVGLINYDKKESINVNMNEGTYKSVEIILGDGTGKNFWTLICPNENNIQNLKYYDSILPGISNIFEDNVIDTEKENKTYSFKFLELIKSCL